jgi:TonB family protein
VAPSPLTLFAALLCGSPSAHSQGAAGPIRPRSASVDYENSTDGLRRLMADVLDFARRADLENLSRSIKEMEIPDFRAWSATALQADQAKSWTDIYAAGLERNEAAFEKLFQQLAQVRGQITVRKIDDSSKANEESESRILATLKQPIEVYVAEWREPAAASDVAGEPIGYFFFLDGKFRWNSAIVLPPPKSTSHAIAPPRLVKRVDPIYPREAQAAGVGGVVALRVKIQIDGRPLIEGVLSGDDRLVEAAKDAVRQWHFEPASLGGKPVEVETRVEVDFVVMRAPGP